MRREKGTWDGKFDVFLKLEMNVSLDMKENVLQRSVRRLDSCFVHPASKSTYTMQDWTKLVVMSDEEGEKSMVWQRSFAFVIDETVYGRDPVQYCYNLQRCHKNDISMVGLAKYVLRAGFSTGVWDYRAHYFTAQPDARRCFLNENEAAGIPRLCSLNTVLDAQRPVRELVRVRRLPLRKKKASLMILFRILYAHEVLSLIHDLKEIPPELCVLDPAHRRFYDCNSIKDSVSWKMLSE